MEPARVLLGSACPRGLLIQQLAVAAPSMHLAVGARSDTAGSDGVGCSRAEHARAPEGTPTPSGLHLASLGGVLATHIGSQPPNRVLLENPSLEESSEEQPAAADDRAAQRQRRQQQQQQQVHKVAQPAPTSGGGTQTAMQGQLAAAQLHMQHAKQALAANDAGQGSLLHTVVPETIEQQAQPAVAASAAAAAAAAAAQGQATPQRHADAMRQQAQQAQQAAAEGLAGLQRQLDALRQAQQEQQAAATEGQATLQRHADAMRQQAQQAQQAAAEGLAGVHRQLDEMCEAAQEQQAQQAATAGGQAVAQRQMAAELALVQQVQDAAAPVAVVHTRLTQPVADAQVQAQGAAAAAAEDQAALRARVEQQAEHPHADAALRTLGSIRDPTMRAEAAAELEASDDRSPEVEDFIVRSVLNRRRYNDLSHEQLLEKARLLDAPELLAKLCQLFEECGDLAAAFRGMEDWSGGAALRTLDSIRDPTMRAEVAAELEASDDHSPEADDHIVRSVLNRRRYNNWTEEQLLEKARQLNDPQQLAKLMELYADSGDLAAAFRGMEGWSVGKANAGRASKRARTD